MLTTAFYVCLVLFVTASVAMLALILLQKGRGMHSLLGGSGGDSVLGYRTPAGITWMTAGTFAVFLLLAIALNLLA